MDVGNTTAAATAPTNANTVELLNTFTALLGTILDAYEIERYILTVTHDQAGTVVLSKSNDGATWDIFASQAVPIPGGTLTVSGPLDFPVGGIRYLKSQWVNGGVTQTLWRPNQKLVERDRAAQT